MKRMVTFFWQLIKGVLKAGIVVVAGLLGLLLLFSLLRFYEYHFGFSRQRWLTGTEVGTNNPREGMVQDVMAHHLKRGMSRQAVLNLLGPAERDGVEMRVPDNIALPDSLQSEKGMTNMKGFNEWHRLNAQPDTIMRYPAGWDMIGVV